MFRPSLSKQRNCPLNTPILDFAAVQKSKSVVEQDDIYTQNSLGFVWNFWSVQDWILAVTIYTIELTIND